MKKTLFNLSKPFNKLEDFGKKKKNIFFHHSSTVNNSSFESTNLQKMRGRERKERKEITRLYEVNLAWTMANFRSLARQRKIAFSNARHYRSLFFWVPRLPPRSQARIYSLHCANAMWGDHDEGPRARCFRPGKHKLNGRSNRNKFANIYFSCDCWLIDF